MFSTLSFFVAAWRAEGGSAFSIPGFILLGLLVCFISAYSLCVLHSVGDVSWGVSFGLYTYRFEVCIPIYFVSFIH